MLDNSPEAIKLLRMESHNFAAHLLDGLMEYAKKADPLQPIQFYVRFEEIVTGYFEDILGPELGWSFNTMEIFPVTTGGEHTEYSKQDDKTIIDMLASGATHSQIAGRLGRTLSGITAHIYTKGLNK